MSAIKHLPLESASELFVKAASDLLEERGFDLTTDHAKKLRSEVIRHYEVAVREQQQTAHFAGVWREARDLAPEKIKNVNSYIGSYLEMHRDPS